MNIYRGLHKDKACPKFLPCQNVCIGQVEVIIFGLLVPLSERPLAEGVDQLCQLVGSLVASKLISAAGGIR